LFLKQYLLGKALSWKYKGTFRETETWGVFSNKKEEDCIRYFEAIILDHDDE
jgi:hypothetical protein